MAKVKKKGVRYWKKKAWDEFSKYIRLRDAIETTRTKEWCLCCTCKKRLPAFGVGCVQAGHFVPGRSHSVLFDERGVHAQCYNCNITLKGNWPNYREFMIARYGKEAMEEVLAQRHKVVKYLSVELEEIRDKYKVKIKELQAGLKSE